MKFISKAANYMLVLKPSAPAEPLTGRNAVPGLSVRFENGVVDVQNEEIAKRMCEDRLFKVDFFLADENVDIFEKQRKDSEPVHSLTEINFGQPGKTISSPVKKKLPEELSKFVNESIEKGIKDGISKILPDLLEKVVKDTLEKKESAKVESPVEETPIVETTVVETTVEETPEEETPEEEILVEETPVVEVAKKKVLKKKTTKKIKK